MDFSPGTAGYVYGKLVVQPSIHYRDNLVFTGMAINIQSDHIVRHLRKPGDTNHYLPKKGLFKYVTSANYFGEIVEWCGFAILTWSASGAIFAWWTFANLVPRANTIYHKYKAMFGNELGNRKRIIPFIY